MLNGDETKLGEDETRSSGDEIKPTAKSGARKRKAAAQDGKKAEPQRRKSVQRQDSQPEQLQEAPEAISAPLIPIAEPAASESPACISLIDSSPAVPVAMVEAVPVAKAEAVPVSYQTLANAYRNYTRQSLDQARSFFEKLAGVRSLDKAIELQTEFAKQAYEGFIAESHKIRELHNELARQRLSSWEGFLNRLAAPR